jgi:hypothetical protein
LKLSKPKVSEFMIMAGGRTRRRQREARPGCRTERENLRCVTPPVEIPKADGGIRPLGIPTVAGRVAQEVARRYLEPILEPVFHPDSYGYRPGKSATDAVGEARERCWRWSG